MNRDTKVKDVLETIEHDAGCLVAAEMGEAGPAYDMLPRPYFGETLWVLKCRGCGKSSESFKAESLPGS